MGKFFPSDNGGGSGSGGGSGGNGGGGGGGGSTLNAFYVANSNPSLATVGAYSIGGSQVTTLTGSPYALGVAPVALALNPAGNLLYAGSLLGGVFVYVVGSDGTLALGNNNAPVASVSVSSIAVDPTGKWLLVLSNTGSGSAPAVYEYQIDATNGTLANVGSPMPLDNGAGGQIVISPDGTKVYASLGTGGVDALTLNPTSGQLAKVSFVQTPSGNSYADTGLAIDPKGAYLFVGETGVNGVRVFAINADATLQEVTGSPYATGLGARAVLVDRTGAYVYVTNSTTGTISAFSLAADGTLTELSGSPFATGASPYALAEDKTGAYLLAACAGGTPDLEVFNIGAATATTPGALSSAAQITTGSQSPAGTLAVVASP